MAQAQASPKVNISPRGAPSHSPILVAKLGPLMLYYTRIGCTGQWYQVPKPSTSGTRPG